MMPIRRGRLVASCARVRRTARKAASSPLLRYGLSDFRRSSSIWRASRTTTTSLPCIGSMGIGAPSRNRTSTACAIGRRSFARSASSRYRTLTTITTVEANARFEQDRAPVHLRRREPRLVAPARARDRRAPLARHGDCRFRGGRSLLRTRRRGGRGHDHYRLGDRRRRGRRPFPAPVVRRRDDRGRACDLLRRRLGRPPKCPRRHLLRHL